MSDIINYMTVACMYICTCLRGLHYGMRACVLPFPSLQCRLLGEHTRRRHARVPRCSAADPIKVVCPDRLAVHHWHTVKEHAAFSFIPGYDHTTIQRYNMAVRYKNTVCRHRTTSLQLHLCSACAYPGPKNCLDC